MKANLSPSLSTRIALFKIWPQAFLVWTSATSSCFLQFVSSGVPVARIMSVALVHLNNFRFG